MKKGLRSSLFVNFLEKYSLIVNFLTKENMNFVYLQRKSNQETKNVFLDLQTKMAL